MAIRWVPAAMLFVLACSYDYATSVARRKPGSCDGPCPVSKIDHVVIINQENHTFDTYFGQWCTAPTGSAPTCTVGVACCEAGPGSDPTGAAPILLDDTANAGFDPNHTQACEVPEADSGKMDKYVTGVAGCSDPRNFAYVDPAIVAPYWQLADEGALADRYFQPVAGESSSNEMYFATASFQFLDDEDKPEGIGEDCSVNPDPVKLMSQNVGQVLDDAGVSWAFYAEGYTTAKQTGSGKCPVAAPGCAADIQIYPCIYDPRDVPFDYFPEYTDNPRVIRDLSAFQSDLNNLSLPQVVFIKGLGFHTDHPGESVTITAGAAFIQTVEQAVSSSMYAPDTLVLVTWDEGGGFFDHIAPPGNGDDGEPYGTRIPLLANGPFVAPGTISHVQMEHSSLVTFLEWNWTGKTGQLGARDAVVHNVGSMLDATKTGVAVPQ